MSAQMSDQYLECVNDSKIPFAGMGKMASILTSTATWFCVNSATYLYQTTYVWHIKIFRNEYTFKILPREMFSCPVRLLFFKLFPSFRHIS